VLDLRRSSYRPPPETAAGSAVLLLSRLADSDFTAVRQLLRGWGVPAIRLDVDDLQGRSIGAEINGLRLDGCLVVPSVVWRRHFSVRAMPPGPKPAESLVSARFRRDAWEAFGRQPGALVQLPGRAPGPLEQITDATRHGVRVPATVVTTDLRDALKALPDCRLVVKALGGHFTEGAPGRLVATFPEIVDRAALAACPPTMPAPVIVQGFVPHQRELRVYWIRGEVCSFAVSKPSPEALWRASEQVTVAEVPTPPAVLKATRLLARVWGLGYGAFDFLMDDGNPVFLEVNADGDWKWFESKAGTRTVTEAAARMLRDLHLAAGGRTVSPDLLSFLARTDLPGHQPVGACMPRRSAERTAIQDATVAIVYQRPRQPGE
jgi:hypothetical protein